MNHAPVPLEDVSGYAQLVCRLRMEDTFLPQHFQGIYLPGLSEGMISSCDLFGVIRAHHTPETGCRVIYNGDLASNAINHGWKGAEWYESCLLNRGVDLDCHILTAPARNTRQECDELVATAKDHGITSVGVVFVPYHWEKLLVCLVGAMAKHDYRLKVWFLRPRHVRWEEKMDGSQGSRKDIAFLEEAGVYIETFFKYLANGRKEDGTLWKSAWGAPIKETLEYLNWRDGS